MFHKTEPPWFESVKDLRPGGKRRLGDGFLASFNGRAYQRYDFREKEAEVWMPQMTLAQQVENLKHLRDAEDSAIQSSQLPELMLHPRDWPVEARTWLYKAGISNQGIQALGAGWSPSMARVVVPVTMMDGSQQWMARNLDAKADPKYLFPKGMKRGGGTFLSQQLGGDTKHPVVITEDYLSAWRIADDASLDTVSALGTSLDRDAIVLIAQRYPGVILWLDPDYYGNLGAAKLHKEFRRFDVPVVMVSSVRDPKNHEPHEVVEYIENAVARLWKLNGTT